MKPVSRDAFAHTEQRGLETVPGKTTLTDDEHAWVKERTRQFRQRVAARGLDPDQPPDTKVWRPIVRQIALELDGLPVQEGGRA